MEFSDKVEHEFEVLERSAVAYVKAWAREEGEVMGVVDSLRTILGRSGERLGFCFGVCSMHVSYVQSHCNKSEHKPLYSSYSSPSSSSS